MTAPQFFFKSLDPDLPEPAYAHADDAGLDLRSRVSLMIPAGSWAIVPTGLAMAVPPGYAAFVHPRSGLAAKNGITVLNAPGTIDAGYRGEVGVVLMNASNHGFTVNRGDRIAQLVFQQVLTPPITWVQDLSETDRAGGGFGSTGV